MNVHHIDIGKEYATHLGGRYKRDGEYSGEEFRPKKFLEPVFENNDMIVLNLDNIQGYTASFF